MNGGKRKIKKQNKKKINPPPKSFQKIYRRESPVGKGLTLWIFETFMRKPHPELELR